MNQIIGQSITPAVIDSGMSYERYRSLIDGLLEEGKTTGTNHSEAMINYTKMNVHRMNRLDKQVRLSDSLKEALQDVDEDWIWLVLTEAWCGDAAQNIPVLVRMAEQNDHVNLRLILRDEHPDIMDEYLTNGGRSIPKLVCLEAETLEELGTWGPRPGEAQQKAMQWKDDPEISTKEWAERLHKWYAGNRTEDIQEEFEELIEQWSE
ncbi:thioredoxin family protein [Fodinibius sp.]|uniref:thioredoxin family protein n=1 Tax=Fodinibius sp. TaxID=1872440 RepID=UPI003566F3E9